MGTSKQTTGNRERTSRAAQGKDDPRFEEVDAALANSVKFLENLRPEDEDSKKRLEEIKFTLERKIDRRRSKT